MVLDVMMPGMDGFETLRQLRRRQHPKIMLTARGDQMDRIVGLSSDDYFVKTIHPIVGKIECHL